MDDIGEFLKRVGFEEVKAEEVPNLIQMLAGAPSSGRWNESTVAALLDRLVADAKVIRDNWVTDKHVTVVALLDLRKAVEMTPEALAEVETNVIHARYTAARTAATEAERIPDKPE